jgi:hypothetical protein
LLLDWTLLLAGLTAARHHRDRAGRQGRRPDGRYRRLTNLCGLHIAARVARRAMDSRLHMALIIDDSHRAGLPARSLMGILRRGRHALASRACAALMLRARLLRSLLRRRDARGLAVGGGGGFLCVVLAHDCREVDRFHLRRLIPSMLAGGAFQRAAFFSQELAGQLEVRSAARTGNPHRQPLTRTSIFYSTNARVNGS